MSSPAGNVIGGPFYVALEFLWHDEVVGSLGFNVGDHDRHDMGWNRHGYTLTAMAPSTAKMCTQPLNPASA